MNKFIYLSVYIGPNYPPEFILMNKHVSNTKCMESNVDQFGYGLARSTFYFFKKVVLLGSFSIISATFRGYFGPKLGW